MAFANLAKNLGKTQKSTGCMYIKSKKLVQSRFGNLRNSKIQNFYTIHFTGKFRDTNCPKIDGGRKIMGIFSAAEQFKAVN